jgi:5'-methylthioadenosine phosphorylase
MPSIAIIGGSGFYKIDGLRRAREVAVKTPFGAPSDKIICGHLGGVEVAFLARHNRRHIYLPSEVPYRANIYALKKLGAKVILSFSAVGSLKEELPPQTFVFPDQIIDKTQGRAQTFFGSGLVGHVSFADPFCNCLQKTLFDAAKKLKIKAARGGTLVCMEGPAFSTRAESGFHRKMGWSLIGMTSCPEVKLAREAGLAYGYCAMVTDYDCWRKGEEVSAAKVNETMKSNEVSAKKLIAAAVPLTAGLKRCGMCNESMMNAVVAQHKEVNQARLKKIKLILE